jgi:hypothetical protein
MTRHDSYTLKLLAVAAGGRALGLRLAGESG